MDDHSPVFLKQMAIRKMVVEMAIPEKTIELVIAHSFKQAHKAFTENASVEISGFGKFVTRPLVTAREKAGYELKIAYWKNRLQEPDVTEKQIIKWNGFIEKMEGFLETIKRIQKHEV